MYHLVPGLILLLVSGFLGIGIDDRPWRLVVAVLFGIGAALTLDVFALWPHLDDVYWAKEDRQSIDAVLTMAALLLLAVVGGGFWIDVGKAIWRAFWGAARYTRLGRAALIQAVVAKSLGLVGGT